MTNREILEKAIQKAIDGGWDGDTRDHYSVSVDSINGIDGLIADVSVEELIFNHEFAQALWPEEPEYHLACTGCEATYNFWEEDKFGDDMPTIKFCNQCGAKVDKVVHSYLSPWRMHLKNMVIADDPIEYLGKYLG